MRVYVSLWVYLLFEGCCSKNVLSCLYSKLESDVFAHTHSFNPFLYQMRGRAGAEGTRGRRGQELFCLLVRHMLASSNHVYGRRWKVNGKNRATSCVCVSERVPSSIPFDSAFSHLPTCYLDGRSVTRWMKRWLEFSVCKRHAYLCFIIIIHSPDWCPYIPLMPADFTPVITVSVFSSTPTFVLSFS